MLEYPKEAVVDYVIPKKDFYENYEMKTRDKNIFTKDIEQIKWLYSLQKDTINIDPYSDEEKDYEEIEVIQVLLKRKTNNLERMAEIIHRVMPYPLLLIFRFNNEFLISVAHKRNSKTDSEKVTLTDMRYTPWMNEDFLGEFDSKLLDKLAIDKLDKGNIYKMYSSMVDAVIITNGSREVGRDIMAPVEKIREVNNEIYYINLDIKKLEANLKKETQFNRQMEINDRIYGLKRKIDDLREELI